MSLLSAIVIALALAASCLAGVRWLRVAQREHYLPGSVLRFAWRWWAGLWPNRGLAAVGVAGVALTPVVAALAVAPCLVAGVGPLGLSLRGRTSPLKWTRRLRVLAATWGVLQLGGIAAATAVGAGRLLAPVLALATPLVVDLACWLTAPVERRLGRAFVNSARVRLEREHPTVVAITGSYGKTTTKGYLAHLVGPFRPTVASPASWNNQAGLSRTINERLALGTEVLVAEMGTYGPGEIAQMCSWVRPSLAVITAIGPVHLERLASMDHIVKAKSEILAGAAAAILNTDDERLAALADRASAVGQRVVRCSGHAPSADVAVIPGPASGSERPGAQEGGPEVGGPEGGTIPATLWAGGSARPVRIPRQAQPTNVACAVAVALDLGVGVDQLADLLPSLPGAPNRLAAQRSASGFTVIDDTYNANPAGARAALAALASAAGPEAQRRVVVTPGMVELGRRQAAENTAFAAAASSVATHLVVVGRTNRRALVQGAAPPLRVTVVAARLQAVEWVRSHLGPGDVVLYENDLPDHYP